MVHEHARGQATVRGPFYATRAVRASGDDGLVLLMPTGHSAPDSVDPDGGASGQRGDRIGGIDALDSVDGLEGAIGRHYGVEPAVQRGGGQEGIEGIESGRACVEVECQIEVV